MSHDRKSCSHCRSIQDDIDRHLAEDHPDDWGLFVSLKNIRIGGLICFAVGIAIGLWVGLQIHG